MTPHTLNETARGYLNWLCSDLPTRRVGSPGNRAATAEAARILSELSWTTETPSFSCMDWRGEGAELTVSGRAFPVLVSPYSVGGQASGPLAVISTVDDLARAQLAGRVALLIGNIATEQLMPKNFVFYNPDRHQRIIQLLEAKAPQAIIAATTMDPGLAGAVSPFPLIVDGDFSIPSVYMTADAGSQLARLAGQTATLVVRAQRSPATGCNVIARQGPTQRRVVLFAHIDAKEGTPGAIDNATGVVILLLLAQLLRDYEGRLGIEIVALNGEDYYAASGEMQYLALNEGRWHEIVLGINLDGVGYHLGRTAYSLYDCPEQLAATVRQVLEARPGLMEGEAWYQSDHGLFLMHQRPALAFTSEQFTTLWMEIAHTPLDTPAIVNGDHLVTTAFALRDLLLRLDQVAL